MLSIRKNIHYLLVLFILCAGLVVRLYKIDHVPYGFFCDEASIGYNAYSILTTGKDEYDISYPLFFRSFGDFRHPIAVYATIPYVMLFGLSEKSVRLSSAIFGVGTIFIIYLLLRQYMCSYFIPALGALIASFLPWLLHYDRVGFEFSSYAFFFSLSTLFAFLLNRDKRYIPIFFLLLGLTIYTYQPAKVIIPVFFLCVSLLNFRYFLRHKYYFISGSILFFILLLPLLFSFLNGEATARFSQISIFSSNLSLMEVVYTATKNYFFQLTPHYLFLTGEGNNMTRHFIDGLLPGLIILLPFFYLGIFRIVKNWKRFHSQILLLWLLVYPLAGIFVYESPFTSRAIIGAPLMVILSAIGIEYLITKTQRYIDKKVSSIFITILLLINVILFLRFYFVSYPLFSSGYLGWQYGPKEIITYFTKHEKEYDSLYMIGEFNAPDIFFKFYAPNNCQKCFIGAPHDVYDKTKRQLFAVSPSYLEQHPEYHFQTMQTIRYPNHSVAFEIGKVVQ